MRKFSIVASLVLLVGLFGTIIIARQVQDTRSRASAPVAGSYGAGSYGGGVYGAGTVATPPVPTNTLAPIEAPAPGSAILHATMNLEGIGPTGNKTPLRQQRLGQFEIYDSQNNLTVAKQATLTYVSESGSFIGIVDLGPNFQSGVYTVKVKVDQYLRALLPGIQTFTAAQANTLPEVSLRVGDINGDNKVNIVDYDILMGCYSDTLPAASCTPANKLLADLTDDGNVNQYDYNIFLRALQTQGGQ